MVYLLSGQTPCSSNSGRRGISESLVHCLLCCAEFLQHAVACVTTKNQSKQTGRGAEDFEQILCNFRKQANHRHGGDNLNGIAETNGGCEDFAVLNIAFSNPQFCLAPQLMPGSTSGRFSKS